MQSLSSVSDSVKTNVVIVGAGLAGLSCAQQLIREANDRYNVIVLEARDRLGGRVHTVDDGKGNSIELGANWIHGDKTNPLVELIKSQKLKGRKTSEDSVTIYRGNQKIGLLELLAINQKIKEIETVEKKAREDLMTDENWKGELGSYDPTISSEPILKGASKKVQDQAWFGPTKKAAVIAEKLLVASRELQEAVNLQNKTDLGHFTYIDEKWLTYQRHEGEDFLISNGTKKVVEAFAANVKVELDSVVDSIHQDVTGLTEVKYQHKGESKSLQADYVVMTAPIELLKERKITFCPKLTDAKLEAIDKMNLGHVQKVILTFKEPYWDNTDFLIMGEENMDDCMIMTNLHAVNPKTNTLIIWFAADKAKENQAKNPELLVDEVLNKLSQRYPDCTRQNLEKATCTNWSTDPYTKGAWSYLPVGSTMGAVHEFSKPEGKVYFAGEHTSPFMGSMHGAIESGQRVANQILGADLLKK